MRFLQKLPFNNELSVLISAVNQGYRKFQFYDRERQVKAAALLTCQRG
jgi:hypothetical protein